MDYCEKHHRLKAVVYGESCSFKICGKCLEEAINASKRDAGDAQLSGYGTTVPDDRQSNKTIMENTPIIRRP